LAGALRISAGNCDAGAIVSEGAELPPPQPETNKPIKTPNVMMDHNLLCIMPPDEQFSEWQAAACGASCRLKSETP
jgi:hypothetical protein